MLPTVELKGVVMKRHLGALLLGAIAVSCLAYVGAQAATSTDTVALAQDEGEQPPAEGRADGPKHRPGMRGAIRGEFVVRGEEEGTFRTVKMDRGVVERVEGSTVVIKEEDGTVVEIPTSGDTRIARDGEQVEISAIQAGDHAFAHRVKEGDGFVTKGVRAFSPERWAEMEQRREACKEDPEQCRRERRERRMGRAEDASA